MNFWDGLDRKYRLILCDVWGVVHDGVNLYPGAAERLRQWRDEGRVLVLITNAPRPAGAVEAQLAVIGLPRDCYDSVATSGGAGIEALQGLAKAVGFIGSASDRAILEACGVRIVPEGFTDLACTGFEEGRPAIDDYRADLDRWMAADVHMHCLNPDRLVVRGGVPEPCAGAIADAYEMIGGRVTWYGKPHPAIYAHALHLAGDPPANEVLAVGDGLQTDILGAARLGFDAVFVSGGIHAGEPFPHDFAERYGLGEWQPVAIVDGLA
jgi:HAD superfamily hydrolase (TIGR01459 family)